MIGNIKWNFAFALVGFIITFLASYSANPLNTSFKGAGFCALALFLIGFVIRLALGLTFIAGKTEDVSEDTPAPVVSTEGQFINEAADDHISLDEILNTDDAQQPQIEEPEFEPFTPVKLERKMDPKEMADAVRTLAND